MLYLGVSDYFAEKYEVEIKWDRETGRKYGEHWTLGGKLHRPDGPAIQFWDPQTGRLTEEIYFLRDRYHRVDGPCEQSWDAKTGHLTSERWAVNGITTREGDLPASVRYDRETGAKLEEHFYLNGLLHRENGPASTYWEEKTKEPIAFEWALDDERSRPGGEPAWIGIDPETDVVIEEAYYEDGELHRIGAPAHIKRDPKTGQVTFEAYYERGQEAAPPLEHPTREP